MCTHSLHFFPLARSTLCLSLTFFSFPLFPLPSSVIPSLHHSDDMLKVEGRTGSKCRVLSEHWCLQETALTYIKGRSLQSLVLRLSPALYFCSEYCNNEKILAYPASQFILKWSKEECSQWWVVLNCSVVSYDLTWAPHWSPLLRVIQLLCPVETAGVSVFASIK